MQNKSAILVWEWDNAPEEFKALSNHGGDEDYVIVADAGEQAEHAEWLVEKIDQYHGSYSKVAYRTINPRAERDVVVFITAHA